MQSPGFSSKTSQPYPTPTPTPKLCVHSQSQLWPPLRPGDTWAYSQFAGDRTITESRNASPSHPASGELELDAPGLGALGPGLQPLSPVPALLQLI